MTKRELVYVDNAATTPVSETVLKAMLPYFRQEYGNPSSIYAIGRKASRAIEEARGKIAAAIGAQPSEVFFTSGGTEADNWAIKSGARLMKAQGKTHIISTNIEHHAVLHSLDFLKKEGFDVTLVPVNKNGIVEIADIEKAIRPETGLVTVMYANNEIGTIQPVGEIGEICKEREILFHTDAVQAVGHEDINVKEQSIDMLSASGHKLHGPKGTGFLYVRRGIRLPNLIDGGGQEKGRRGGTENVPSIVGLGVAVEESVENMAEKNESMRKKSQKIMDELLKLPHTRLNGDRNIRLAGNVNISFEGIEGESILLMLDNAGISASSGSACTSGSLDPSHVLLGIGLTHEVAHGSLRISLSEYTTDEEVDYIIEQVPKAVEKLRNMSPLWDMIVKNEN